MTRALFTLVIALLSIAPVSAAQRKPGGASADSIPLDVEQGDELPVPPVPPSENEYLAAPVPDTSLGDPSAIPAPPKGAEITPGFYHPRDYNIGQGYLDGSTVAGTQERKAAPVPSLRLKVPLE